MMPSGISTESALTEHKTPSFIRVHARKFYFTFLFLLQPVYLKRVQCETRCSQNAHILSYQSKEMNAKNIKLLNK